MKPTELSMMGYPSSWDAVKRDKSPFEWENMWWFITVDPDTPPYVHGPFDDMNSAWLEFNTYALETSSNSPTI